MEDKERLLPQISVVMAIQILWEYRVRILCIAFVCGVIGFFLAMGIPKKYRTVVTLAPESSESDIASAASSITSMLGMNLGASGADAIYPELYPDIVNTIPFSVEMLNIQVCTMDNSYCGDLYHYLLSHQKSPWWSRIQYKIKYLLSKQSRASVPDVLDGYRLTKKQMALIESFHHKVTCEVDVKTSVITISSSMQDKLVACTVADSMCSKLQEYITSYKTNKARGDLNSVMKMYKDAQKDYLIAQQKYASFVDRNSNLVRESSRAEAVRLENEMDMTFSVYSELSSQVAMARAKLLEQTPAFTVLEPARLAEWHFAPKRSKSAILFAFLGGVITCMVYLFKRKKELFL